MVMMGKRGGERRIQAGAQTFEDIRLAFLHSLEGCLHEQAGKFPGIDALLPPLIHPICYPHPYDAMPAHVSHVASVYLVMYVLDN